jgi:hypothetical protein
MGAVIYIEICPGWIGGNSVKNAYAEARHCAEGGVETQWG